MFQRWERALCKVLERRRAAALAIVAEERNGLFVGGQLRAHISFIECGTLRVFKFGEDGLLPGIRRFARGRQDAGLGNGRLEIVACLGVVLDHLFGKRFDILRLGVVLCQLARLDFKGVGTCHFVGKGDGLSRCCFRAKAAGPATQVVTAIATSILMDNLVG